MTPTPKDIATAVPADFRLPWNTTRTLADVWGTNPAPEPVEDAPPCKASKRQPLSRSEAAKRGGDALAAKRRKQFVEDYQKRKRLTKAGKIPFAGYDPEEARS